MSAKEILLNWFGKDDMQKVFEGLFSLSSKYKDEKLKDDIIFQSSRFESLEKKQMKNLISHENEYLETAKIKQALLKIIHDLPNNWRLNKSYDTIFPALSVLKNTLYFAIFFIGSISYIGYCINGIFIKPSEIIEQKTKSLPPSKANTSGDFSPAVITNEGDVNINYEKTKPSTDSLNTPIIQQK